MQKETIGTGPVTASAARSADECRPLMSEVPPAVRAHARVLLAPGEFCILDCETTGFDGSIVEIAVVAADTGEVLLDTLVDPDGVEICDRARDVHGIGEDELAGAPRWDQVYPDLAAAIGVRRIAAYNAVFDHGRILHDCTRYGIDAGNLVDFDRWECVMELRSNAHCSDKRLRLDAGHRALGDVEATRDLLDMIARGIAP